MFTSLVGEKETFEILNLELASLDLECTLHLVAKRNFIICEILNIDTKWLCSFW